jgi:hypothetical protein
LYHARHCRQYAHGEGSPYEVDLLPSQCDLRLQREHPKSQKSQQAFNEEKAELSRVTSVLLFDYLPLLLGVSPLSPELENRRRLLGRYWWS